MGVSLVRGMHLIALVSLDLGTGAIGKKSVALRNRPPPMLLTGVTPTLAEEGRTVGGQVALAAPGTEGTMGHPTIAVP